MHSSLSALFPSLPIIYSFTPSPLSVTLVSFWRLSSCYRHGCFPLDSLWLLQATAHSPKTHTIFKVNPKVIPSTLRPHQSSSLFELSIYISDLPHRNAGDYNAGGGQGGYAGQAQGGAYGGYGGQGQGASRFGCAQVLLLSWAQVNGVVTLEATRAYKHAIVRCASAYVSISRQFIATDIPSDSSTCAIACPWQLLPA